MKTSKTAAIILFVCMVAGTLFASDPTIQQKTYVTRPVNPHPPAIDGRLNDGAWQNVPWAGDFVQREPNDGAPPSEPTAFKILYDDSNLYVAIRAYDSQPEKIVRRVSRRDGFEGDWVEINIDSYFDHRTAFSFTMTAAGVKGDEAVSNDGGNWDSNWDPVWFAEVTVDDSGWVAEMRIPFSQLRFAKKAEHVWGLQVNRRLFRKDERSVWQYIPKNASGWVSNFGLLKGIRGIQPPRRIELLPYGVSGLTTQESEPGNPFASGEETRLSAGLDAKIGVTSNLTLDVTINPDFGQVEADPSEVNLTAFETFFEEKRPFFIEGQNILDYRIMLGDGGFSNDRLFYSRRIGRSPQYTPDIPNDAHMQMPDNTSILTAVKLTGKTPSGLSIGVLDAVTQKEQAQIELNGQRFHQTVEPATNYFVGRLQKDYNDGNSSLGGIFTATNRDLSDAELRFLNRAAYSGGMDFRHQWDDKTYTLDVRTAFSHIRGDQEAILRAQTASVRYYQRPDADHVAVDSSSTSLSGHGGFVNFGRGGNSPLRFFVGSMWRSPGLELNDLGFLRQADRILQWSWVGYRPSHPVSIFRQLNINFNQWAGWTFGGETIVLGGNVNGGGQLKNYWNIWMGVARQARTLATSTLRGGPALKLPNRWNQWYSLSTDNRKALQLGFGGFNSLADDGDSRTHNVRFTVSYRPHDGMRISLNPFYTFNKNDLQYVNTLDFDGEPRYLLGRLRQKTLGITIRLDWSLTPTLSIQYYGQPFISSGRYDQFKIITDPRAERYGDRFRTFAGDEVVHDTDINAYRFDEDGDNSLDYSAGNPNFDFRQFRSNLVVRWEYQPGSTLFLVWSQERTDADATGRFSIGNDFEALFEAHPTNVFLIKVSRWFSL